MLNGLAKPSFEEDRDISQLFNRLRKLVEAARPLLLDFRRTIELKEQIELLERGHLQILITAQEAQSVNEPYFYIYLDNSYGYFQKRQKNPLGKFVVILSNSMGAGTAMTVKVAEQVKATLAQDKIKASVVPGRNISEDSVIEDNFEEMWGEVEQELPPVEGPSDPRQRRMMRLNHDRRF